jgi:hypothetical protein
MEELNELFDEMDEEELIQLGAAVDTFGSLFEEEIKKDRTYILDIPKATEFSKKIDKMKELFNVDVNSNCSIKVNQHPMFGTISATVNFDEISFVGDKLNQFIEWCENIDGFELTALINGNVSFSTSGYLMFKSIKSK